MSENNQLQKNKQVDLEIKQNLNQEQQLNINGQPQVAPIQAPGQQDQHAIRENKQAALDAAIERVELAMLDMGIKTYRTNRTNVEIVAENETLRAKNKQKDYRGSKQQMLDNAQLLKNESEILIRDKKWYRIFNRESDDMKNVKQSVAYLNNLLDGDVKKDKNERLDVLYMIKKVIPAYQTVYEMCDKYLVSHANKGKRTVGQRRKDQVKKVMDMVLAEMNDMKLVIDNAYVGINLEGITSIRELLGEVRVKRAAVSRFMPEGNSSNVYRVRVIGEDGKYYYVKKDEKLLHENMPAYVDIRLNELRRSKEVRTKYGEMSPEEYKNAIKALDDRIREIDEAVRNQTMTEEDGDKAIIAIRAQREELRLEGKIDMVDYDDAIEFLTEMYNGLSSAQSKEKQASYQALLAHDFDKFFKGLKEYNANVDKLKGDSGQIDHLISTLKKEKKEGWQVQVRELEKIKAGGALVKKNELQWFTDHLDMFGITQEKDPALMAVITKIGARENGLFKLFTRSLGKEAELFGQHAERSGLSNSDILASNNTATSRMAGLLGFNDVVTTSFKGKLDYTEVGKTQSAVNNVTFSEEAPGEEMLDIIANAKKEGAKVRLSSNAIRQKNRMHVNDLVTLQTDRHWRNIKALYHKVEGNPSVWVIDSLKCYDHDQSFGNKDLKTYFADETDEATGEIRTKREGFLTPIMMTVTKGTPFYKYVKKTKMTSKAGKVGVHDNKNFMDDIELPRSKTKSLDEATANYKKSYDGHDQYTVNPWQMVDRAMSTFRVRPGTEDLDNLTQGALAKNEGKEKLLRKFFRNFSKLAQATADESKIGVTDELLTDKEDEINPSVREAIDRRVQQISERNKSFQMSFHREVENEDEVRDKIESYVMSRKEMFRLFKETYEIYQQLDLTGLEDGLGKHAYDGFTGGHEVKGFYDYSIQGFFYTLKLEFQVGDSSEGLTGQKLESWKKNKKALEEIKKEDEQQEKEELRQKIREANPNLAGKALDREVDKEYKKANAETVRMPAILHMDREAYQSVVDAYNNPELLEYMLKDLNMTLDKKEALRNRLAQIIEEANEASEMVKQWADMQELPQDDIRRKFFLDPEDYEKIDSITDMALDPGMSYYSVEDSQFLTSLPEMQQFLKEEDREKSRKITNEERNTQRQRRGDMEGEYETMVENTIVKGPVQRNNNNQAA